MMSNTIEFYQYSVTMCCNRPVIYIKIIDNISYKCYETLIKSEDIEKYLRVTYPYIGCYQIMNVIEEEMLISLLQIYNIMYDSFKRINGYSVEIQINNTIMTPKILLMQVIAKINAIRKTRPKAESMKKLKNLDWLNRIIKMIVAIAPILFLLPNLKSII